MKQSTGKRVNFADVFRRPCGTDRGRPIFTQRPIVAPRGRHGTAWMALLLCVVIAGCGARSPSESTLLQLNWTPDAQHGGFYAALVEGFYAEEGLNVEIVPGGPGAPIIPKLTMGRCDFAVANADQVLLARQQDADLLAVFAAMQNSPRCIMVHAESGIRTFDELKNLVLALGEGKAFAEYLKHKIPLTGVRIVSYSGSVGKFLFDKSYAQQGYVFSEPIVAAARGGDPRVLMVSDLGFNPYSSLVITRRGLWDSDRELVERFVRATRRGWQSYLEDPAAANRAILAANPELDADMLAKAAEALRPLCRPADAGPERFGEMTQERWKTLRSQLIEIGLLPADAGPADAAFVNVESPERATRK